MRMIRGDWEDGHLLERAVTDGGFCEQRLLLRG
jgi:hypothetical protein